MESDFVALHSPAGRRTNDGGDDDGAERMDAEVSENDLESEQNPSSRSVEGGGDPRCRTTAN